MNGLRVTVLGAGGGQAPGVDTTGFLLGTQVLLDAGAIALHLPAEAQRAIRHVLVTHTHLDHLHALPFLLDNLIGRRVEPVVVHSTADVLAALRQHVFNGLMWPDFTRLPSPEAPVVRLEPLEPGQAAALDGWRVTAVPVDHTVPALGYVIQDGAGSVVFSGDTGPTAALWRHTADLTDLRAVFLETSFPAAQQELATRTRHLAIPDVVRELSKAKVPRQTPVYLYHLKPEYRDEIVREAAALGPWRIRAVEQGEVLVV